MDIFPVLKTIAPWIATALGGPLGGLAVDVATQALGVNEKTAEGLKSALAGATQEQILALKKADQEFAVQMQELGFKRETDLEKITSDDRASARDMQKVNKSVVPALLTCFVVGAFTATLVLLLKFDVPATNRDIVVYMIGQLSGGFTSALAFWLGTTRHSENKTELLAKAPAIK